MKLAALLLLTTLFGCAPKPPRGVVCWPDKGYIVCQFLYEEPEKKMVPA